MPWPSRSVCISKILLLAVSVSLSPQIAALGFASPQAKKIRAVKKPKQVKKVDPLPSFEMTDSNATCLAIEALVAVAENDELSQEALHALSRISLKDKGVANTTLRALLRIGLKNDPVLANSIINSVGEAGIAQEDVVAEMIAAMEVERDGRETLVKILKPYHAELLPEIRQLLLSSKRPSRLQLATAFRLVEEWGNESHGLTDAIVSYFKRNYESDWAEGYSSLLAYGAENSRTDFFHVLYALAEIGASAKEALPIAIHASKSPNEKYRAAGILCIEKLMKETEPWLSESDSQSLLVLLNDSRKNNEQIKRMFERKAQSDEIRLASVNRTSTATRSSTSRSSTRSRTQTRSGQFSESVSARENIEGRYGRLMTDYDEVVAGANEWMEELDVDKSGAVVLEEFNDDTKFDVIDKNGDREISQRELVSFELSTKAGGNQIRSTFTSYAKQLIRAYDKDGDGLIGRAEQTTMRRKIEGADRNRDGALSVREIAEHYSRNK